MLVSSAGITNDLVWIPHETKCFAKNTLMARFMGPTNWGPPAAGRTTWTLPSGWYEWITTRFPWFHIDTNTNIHVYFWRCTCVSLYRTIARFLAMQLFIHAPTSGASFTDMVITLIPAWMNIHNHYKVPLKFKELIRYFISHLPEYVLTYPSWDIVKQYN